MQKSFLRVV